MTHTKRYILTGTPGAGKTALIRLLETWGHFVVEEAATDINALDLADGIQESWALPAFIDRITALQKQRQIQTASLPFKLQFFDRSPLDTVALCLYLNRPIPSALTEEIERIERERIFQKTVFFIENLGFCQPTEVRKISYEDALRFERFHEEVYASRNYECIRIAPKPVKERGEEILRFVFQTRRKQ